MMLPRGLRDFLIDMAKAWIAVTLAAMALVCAMKACHGLEIKTPGVYANQTFSGQVIVGRVDGVTIENCHFINGPTAPGDSGAHLIIASYASNVTIVGCTFDGTAYRAALSRGRHVRFLSSGVHGSAQSDASAPASFFSDGFKMIGSGIQEVRGCTIKNVGGMGIVFFGVSAAGDGYVAADNVIEGCGQAGMQAWKTRGMGVGLSEGNLIRACNRLAGTPGALGNAACGIHLNDGVEAGVDASKPFINWTVRGNTIAACAAPASPRNEDSGGIAVDFNANGAVIERNVIYANWGKGIYIYNADRCTVRGNVLWSNDSGIVVSSAGPPETAAGNQVSGNVLLRNYNGPERGPGYDCEILVFRTVDTLVSGNYLWPEPGKRATWNMGQNAGLSLKSSTLLGDDWPASAPRIETVIVEKRVSRQVRLIGEILAVDAETGDILGRIAPGQLEN